MPVREEIVVSLLLTVFDLLGTFAFAISGAIAGARNRLDIFGILVLSFAAATSEKRNHTCHHGNRHVAEILNRSRRHIANQHISNLFAVAGAGKALAYHLDPIPAALLGMLTGIGGGVVRDVLLSEVPVVFRTEVYAVAALVGASAVVVGDMMQWPAQPVAIGGALLCFGIRMMAIRHGWRFPIARTPESPHE